MSSLGNIGSFYMVFLIILLIIGLGMLAISLINYMLKPTNNKRIRNDGGNFMQNNSWLKLALFSFIGIIVSVIVLGFLSPSGVTGSNIFGHQDMQQGAYGTMNNMSNMNNVSSGMTPMQNMGLGNMNGNMGSMDSSVIMNNFYQMQMQINQIQMQMTQLQQMMGSMQMQNMSSGSSGMSAMPAGGSMSTTTPDPAAGGGMAMSMPMM